MRLFAGRGISDVSRAVRLGECVRYRIFDKRPLCLRGSAIGRRVVHLDELVKREGRIAGIVLVKGHGGVFFDLPAVEGITLHGGYNAARSGLQATACQLGVSLAFGCGDSAAFHRRACRGIDVVHQFIGVFRPLRHSGGNAFAVEERFLHRAVKCCFSEIIGAVRLFHMGIGGRIGDFPAEESISVRLQLCLLNGHAVGSEIRPYDIVSGAGQCGRRSAQRGNDALVVLQGVAVHCPLGFIGYIVIDRDGAGDSITACGGNEFPPVKGVSRVNKRAFSGIIPDGVAAAVGEIVKHLIRQRGSFRVVLIGDGVLVLRPLRGSGGGLAVVVEILKRNLIARPFVSVRDIQLPALEGVAGCAGFSGGQGVVAVLDRRVENAAIGNRFRHRSGGGGHIACVIHQRVLVLRPLRGGGSGEGAVVEILIRNRSALGLVPFRDIQFPALEGVALRGRYGIGQRVFASAHLRIGQI